MTQPQDRYGQGFARGMEHGRALLLGRIRRRLNDLHGNAVRFSKEGDMVSTPSVYWEARADLLAKLIEEFGEL